MKKYKYIGTEEQLRENYFYENGRRGIGYGWEHYVDEVTKEIKYADEEYAKKYEKIGGLKSFVKDLIALGLVVEEL